MPDYAEAALEAGWYKEGQKWKHADQPGKVHYNAKEIYETLPNKRPCSIDWRPPVVEQTQEVKVADNDMAEGSIGKPAGAGENKAVERRPYSRTKA